MGDKKVSREELERQLAEASRRLPVGPWQHYKGGLYQIEGLAFRENDLEPLVLYRAWADPLDGREQVTFARPVREWEESVEYEGRAVPRFILYTGPAHA